MAYRSLYRRYRPQKFAELRGQTHVVNALRNAVRDDRVGHAYLLSGPRGTGKTTAARILAKALNCDNPVEGEPDGTCDSCRSIEAGTSFDLHELDAASNNKVDDMRELLKKVVLGSPGRTKVYLLDEVHMLSSGAENALLKTLEEPPGHVVFVLATTEPHKVVATIRSRTQHLELTLIAADEMAELVREIATDASLDIDDETVGHVVKVGGGSARDTLSALDQVVAAGGMSDVDNSVSDLLEALASNDAAIALRAVETATERGVPPRRIGEDFLDALRSVFLTKMGAPPARLSEPERALSAEFVERLSPARITRSLELVGRSLIDMRQAPDPRIDLEVALVRVCGGESDSAAAGLLERVEALEAALGEGRGQTESTAKTSSTPPDEKPSERPTKATDKNERPRRPADAARAALKDRPQSRPDSSPRQAKPNASSAAARPESTSGSAPPPPSMRSSSPSAEDQSSPAADTEAKSPPAPRADRPAAASAVTLEALQAAWADILDGRSTKARARFLAGRVDAIDNGQVRVVLSSDALLTRCEPFKAEVEAAMAEMFDESLSIVLAIADSPGEGQSNSSTQSSAPVEDEADIDIHDLTDHVGDNSVVDQIAETFPGAEVVDQTEG